MRKTTPRPTLQTPRLILRPFRREDAPRVQVLAGDKDVANTTGVVPHPYPDGMAEMWISSHQENWSLGEAAQFAITLRETGELVGCIGVSITKAHRRGDLGYWIGKAFWNQGIATESVRAVIAFGFEELGLNKVAARYMSINPASGRVLAKAGMSEEGCLRQEFFKDGEFLDLVLYGITRDQ